MKKTQTISLWIIILFCIDFSLHQLLGFELLATRILNMKFWGNVFACIIGISAFISILLLKNER